MMTREVRELRTRVRHLEHALREVVEVCLEHERDHVGIRLRLGGVRTENRARLERLLKGLRR